MNARRIAAIHLELAKLHQELAEAMAPDEDGAAPAVATKARKVRVHPPPLHPPTELDRARARKMLRHHGMGT